MQPAPLRNNEAASLRALRELLVLDSEPEPEFDALAHAAASILGAPIALVSLVDADRQWFKANAGLEGVTQTARDLSFCAHAVLADRLFVIEDASRDARFADNPLVVGEPHIRFYAGSPLRLSSGVLVGTLCVVDSRPRCLSLQERFTLERLALAVVRALEGRFAVRAMGANALNHRGSRTAQILVEAARTNVDAAMAQLYADGSAAESADAADLMSLCPADFDTALSAKRSRHEALPKLSAMHCCLQSTLAMLGITHRLLQPEATLTHFERAHAWTQLANETKIAGRGAYRAALILTDPFADREMARGG